MPEHKATAHFVAGTEMAGISGLGLAALDCSGSCDLLVPVHKAAARYQVPSRFSPTLTQVAGLSGVYWTTTEFPPPQLINAFVSHMNELPSVVATD